MLSNIFYFHPDPCGNDPIFSMSIFFRWVAKHQLQVVQIFSTHRLESRSIRLFFILCEVNSSPLKTGRNCRNKRQTHRTNAINTGDISGPPPKTNMYSLEDKFSAFLLKCCLFLGGHSFYFGGPRVAAPNFQREILMPGLLHLLDTFCRKI